MSKLLYLECNSGISGDMTAAALLDLGADREKLEQALRSVPAEGFRTEISRVMKSAIDCCDFHVILDEKHENHDHDMAYLYSIEGHEHTHDHEHVHGHEDTHDHHGRQEHDHHKHGHHHEHRSFREVKEILKKIDMSERAYEIALRIFTIIAEAEAAAHNRAVEEVHFHEVGAIDSIVDIVSVSVLFDSLDIDEVVVPYLAEGTGTVRCQHGLLPVPVPAAAYITGKYGIPLRMTQVQGEFVTPTGAAIAAALRTRSELPEVYTIKRVGLGAGKRESVLPGFVRAMVIETIEQAGSAEQSGSADQIWKLETDIDDCTGEKLGYCMERLFEAGALDVHYVPVYMKKNRPGYLLVVICSEKTRKDLEQIIFNETTTIGIRRIPVERTCLERRIVTISTPLGEARAKVAAAPDGDRFYPEYETAAELARKSGTPIAAVYRMIEKEFE